MWPASLESADPLVWPPGARENLCKPSRGGMCHVPCATNRPMIGTIVVPAFRCVEWCHAGPDQTSRSGAIPGNAWTHIHPDWQTRPANYFSPAHQRKSSFIERSMRIWTFIHYDFGSFASMAPSRVAWKHDFVAKVAGGCSSYDVIVPWPDLTRSNIFCLKLRKVCPIR